MTLDWTVRVSDIVMILAVFVGPIVAVQLTEWLRTSKELRERRDSIFRTLMSTRSATLAPAHIEALNLVDVLFHSKKPQDRKVVDSWKLYLAHMNDHSYPRESWGARKADLLHDLLYDMGSSLGYSFDRSHIKAGTYYPHGYEDAERDQYESRKLWLEVARGARTVPITIRQEQEPADPFQLP